MPSDSYLSRREMILASGILVSSIAQSDRVWGGSPAADQDLIYRTADPNNAEPTLEDLVASWITPTRHFYIRSHAPNPDLEASSFRLRVDGLVDRPLELSLEELKRFGETEITATLTCAGNRRAEFNREGEVGGVQWEAGPIGNATWRGVPLAAVLEAAGVQATAQHVWFEGLDQIEHDGDVIPFGASIPLDKALETGDLPGTLLAYGMNGEPLTADHGFPLRSVVPGYIGARSVKWLGRITLADRPSDNHFVATAYKLVRDTQPLDWAEAGPIYRYPINAAATLSEESLAPGKATVRGYVLPTGKEAARVREVQVSTDGGKHWKPASLTGRDQAFCWQLWEAEVEVDASTEEIIVRATDSHGGFMPPRVPWNAKGYLQNAWYRVPINVQ